MTGLLHSLTEAVKLGRELDVITLRVDARLKAIGETLEAIMAQMQDFDSLLTGINSEADRLAAKVQELIGLVSASGITGPQEDEILTRLQAIRDRLTVIGSNPTDPIPTPPPGE